MTSITVHSGLFLDSLNASMTFSRLASFFLLASERVSIISALRVGESSSRSRSRNMA